MDVIYVLFLLIWLRSDTEGSCLPFSCDFGSSEMFCGMIQGVDDDFEWKLTKTSNKAETGPSEDHTDNTDFGEGRFLWADSNDASPSKKATISTPLFNLTDGEGWLTFWYHLYGDGTLEIRVCQGGGPVLTLHGDKGNQWYQQNLTVACGINSSQLTFTSLVNSDESDVGVDDLCFSDVPLTTTDTSVIDTSVTYSVTTHVSTTTNKHISKSYSSVTNMTTLAEATTVENNGSSTLILPLPRKGPDVALPISLSIVAVSFVAALIMVACFIKKRRQQPEKPISRESVHSYDNNAYSTKIDEVRDNTTDTQRNRDSTFDSSTWRSEVSTMNDRGANDTLGGSQPPNRASQASGAFRSDISGDAPDPETRQYFVLNPERASRLVDDAEGEARNQYDPVALYDNKPERYTYIDNEGSSTAMATGDPGDVGMDANAYDPVTIKDDITGGYQFLDSTGTTMANGVTDHAELRSPYEPITVREKPSKSKKTNVSNRKAPIPAARKNVPPQHKERMVDNVLYKPMNGERMVDNVLYNPIQEGK